MKLLILVGAALTLSINVQAGVKEKKAIKKMQEGVTEMLKSTKKSCGNTSIEVKFDLKSYKDFYSKNEKKMKIKRDEERFLYGYAKRNTIAVLEALNTICKDPDYKAEVAKVKVINITPNSAYDNNTSSFKLGNKGTALTASLITNQFSRRSSDFEDDIKKIW